MLFDGITNQLFFLLLLGVVATHHTLQLREFANHVAHQVGLTQVRCAAHEVLVATGMTGDILGESDNPIAFIPEAAEFFLEYDRIESNPHHIQPLFLVLGKEEARIGEARTDNALVTPGNQVRVYGYRYSRSR